MHIIKDIQRGKPMFEEILSKEELLHKIDETYTWLQKNINYYKEKAEQKDEEIKANYEQQLNDYKLELSRCFFHFSEKEYNAIRDFRKRHYESCTKDNKLASGKGTIHWLSDGLCTVYTIECPICHATEEIFDEENIL